MLNKLYKNLENYKEAFEKFEQIDRDKLYAVNDESNSEQLELLKSLNTIVNALNQFNSSLIVYHPIISKNKALRDYSKFYNNLVMSKMKHFFFREEPKKSLSDIDTHSIELIYKIAKKITVIQDIDTIKEELANYYFRIFLLFDFLYTKKDRKLIGYFTSFKANLNNFKKVKTKILKKLNEVKNTSQKEESFRTFSDEVIGIAINEYFAKPIEINTPNDIKIVYKEFIEERQDGNKISIEPFSYFIAYDIWKHGKLLHRLPDVVDIIDNKIEEYIKHIEQYFTLIEEIYTDEIVDYKKIFNFQYKFIKKINDFIIFDDIDLEELEKQKFNTDEVKLTKLTKSSKKKINFHIDKMICGYSERLKIEEINYLFIKLFKSVQTNDKTILFGLYSSGAFLSHMYNLFTNKNLPIVLFKTFPSVSFQPVYSKDIIKNYSNSVIFDDTVRTGFTVSLLKNAYFRLTGKNLDNYIISTFTKNKFLEDLYKELNLKYIANHYYDEIMLFQYKFDNNIENFIDKDIGKTLKSIIGDFSNKIDYNVFLSNSKVAFSIAWSMSNKIIEKYKLQNNDAKSQKIDLFLTSSASKTLALLVAYILRLEDYIVVFDSTKLTHFKVAIDLTIKTKHTLKHQMLFVKDIDYDDLDLICVIYNYGKKDKRIFEVIDG